MKPDVDEFNRFMDRLMADAPDDYEPWLFRVESGSKAPDISFGSWKDEENRLTRLEAVKWMQDGGNVGIAGTDEDALINVDIDDEDETTSEDLKSTLVARSRSRIGVHAWYFEADGADIPNISTDDAGEVRGNWQYVVAPGSYVETDPEDVPEEHRDKAGYYTVELDEPVAEIEFDDLPDVFIEWHREAEQAGAEPELEDEPPTTGSDGQSALFDITASDVVAKEGGASDPSGRWPSLFHGSDTGANMSLSGQGLLQCWRHEVAHNGLQALAVLSDYQHGCAKVGAPHRHSGAGPSCISSGDDHIWYAWKYAKENGYIPEDDRVPYRAMCHLARKHELCAVSDVPKGYNPEEGERLPAEAYDAAISIIENHYELDSGREKTAEFDDGNTEKKRAEADGGAAAVSRGSMSPELPEGPFATAKVRAEAGLGEDDEISDLDDRQKAAVVWRLVKKSDDHHVRWRTDNSSLWAYQDGVWKPEGEIVLRTAARKTLGAENYGQNVLGELKANVTADMSRGVGPDEFGVETGKIATQNGLVHLDAHARGYGEYARRPLKPTDYALTQLPVEHDPDADYGEWDELVEEWAEDGMADALQEYAGYCLHIGALPIDRVLLLVGSGRNGKGTFLSTVRSMLGRQNTTSLELQTLANEQDAVADFYGSIANIDDDLSARKLGAGLGMFKKLSAGDRVRGRRLYEEGFEFDAVGKHLYAANKVPQVDVPDDDTAFWSRWLLVEFPNYYPQTERNNSLRDRLHSDENLSAVLNWAIEGRRRLLEQGYFTNERQYAGQKRERWQAWGESVDQFISECVERDPDAPRISTQDAHRRYSAWCREKDEDTVSQMEFTNKLKEEDVEYKSSIRIDGKVKRGYAALGFTDNVPELDDTPARDPDPDADSKQDSLL